MSNKTDKLNEVIAFIEANPGQSNNWYAKNNGVVSRATFFRMLSNKEIETNETALVSNETAQNETAHTSKKHLFTGMVGGGVQAGTKTNPSIERYG